MTHDPLCPTHRSNSAWLIRPRDCDYCKVIAKVREDERAKCIAAVKEAPISGGMRDPLTGEQRVEVFVDVAVAALRALEEKP